MHIQVSSANQLTMTKIWGQLHIFQAHSQHKTKVGVQLKKKLMLYWKVCNVFDYYLWDMKCTLHCCNHKPLEPFLTRRHEDSKIGQMGNTASRVWHHICPHQGKRQHSHRCYLQALHNRHLWGSNKKSTLTCNAQITTTQVDKKVEANSTCQFTTITAAPQHELHNTVYPTKTR